LSENLEIFPGFSCDKLFETVREMLTVRVIEREVRSDLGENEDRILNMHVTSGTEGSLETLYIDECNASVRAFTR